MIELDDGNLLPDDENDAKTPIEQEIDSQEDSAIENRKPVVGIPLPVSRASRTYLYPESRTACSFLEARVVR